MRHLIAFVIVVMMFIVIGCASLVSTRSHSDGTNSVDVLPTKYVFATGSGVSE